MKILNVSSWADDVVESLQKLGGQGTASEIASIVKTSTKHNRETKDWKSSVLNVLNDYCSTKVDHKRIQARKPDHPSLFLDSGKKGRERLWSLQYNKKFNPGIQTEILGTPRDVSKSKKIDHTKWSKIALKELVNHIKNYSGGNRYISYGELAKRINYPRPHTGNLFGLQIGRTLRAMGHMFDDLKIDGETIPLIQSLVVSSGSKLPSDGLKEFSKTYSELSTEKKKDFVQIEYDKIFMFGARWDKVLEHLNIVPDPGDKQKSDSNRRYNPYGSEGSPEHRRLRDYVANNPSILNLPADVKGIVEYPLKSGDSVDVVFELEDKIVAVEVKSSRSGSDDLERGIYQCVKYKAVLEAEIVAYNSEKEIQSFLVIEGELTSQLKKIENKLAIMVLEKFTPV